MRIIGQNAMGWLLIDLEDGHGWVRAYSPRTRHLFARVQRETAITRGHWSPYDGPPSRLGAVLREVERDDEGQEAASDE